MMGKNPPPATPCPTPGEGGKGHHTGPRSAHAVGSHHRHAGSHKPAFGQGTGRKGGGKGKAHKDMGGGKTTY